VKDKEIMRQTGRLRWIAAPGLAAILAAAASGCASAKAETRAGRADAPPAASRDGFPSDWDLGKGAAASDGFPTGWELSKGAAVSDGFPEGWAMADEKPAPLANARAAAALSTTLAASSTVSSDADLAKARTQVGKAGNMLSRLRGTGYQVLVQDDLKAIDGLLEEARRFLSAGNAPETRRLADDCARRLERARTRIQAETQQPLRW